MPEKITWDDCVALCDQAMDEILAELSTVDVNAMLTESHEQFVDWKCRRIYLQVLLAEFMGKKAFALQAKGYEEVELNRYRLFESEVA